MKKWVLLVFLLVTAVTVKALWDNQFVRVENVWITVPSEFDATVETDDGVDCDSDSHCAGDGGPIRHIEFTDYLENVVDEFALIRVLKPEQFIGVPVPYFEEYVYTAKGLPSILEARPNLAETEELYDDAVLLEEVPFKAFLAYVDFENGSGYRFLTHRNNQPVYAFIGMTDDREYLALAYLPILSPETPSDSTELTAFYESFAPDAYQPTINTLDKLMASLRITQEN